MGLNTARTLYGEIELTSGGHRLQLRNDNLSVEPAGESPGTTLWLKRPPSLRGSHGVVHPYHAGMTSRTRSVS